MIRHTANYSYTNHNFVVQNLKEKRTDSPLIPAVCVLKNLLSRGKPTKMSSFLRDQLGEIHESPSFDEFIPLVSEQPSRWERIIRGDTKGNYNPAKHFYEVLIPKYFPEYPFLQQLIIPEVPINFITQVEVDDFKERQVDFYLPQALMIIEIDGSQHNPREDKIRDEHLKKFGNETYRFSTREIESEDQSFLDTVDRIKHRIERVSKAIGNRNAKNKEPEYIPTIDDYTSALGEEFKHSDERLIATAIIRFQILLLDLIEYGRLSLRHDWNIEIKTDFNADFEELAIQDLLLWLENICQLQKIDFKRPNVSINRGDTFGSSQAIKIDFSIHKRYTDEFQNNPGIIYCRSDYFDHHLYYKNTNGVTPEIVGFRPYDFYKLSSAKPVNYKLKFDNDSDHGDEKALAFVLDNLFGYNSFRDGQLPVIANALSLNSTIGLLPTGGGKSICYQLPVFLQPGVSFVVCPIKSLMFDQKHDLVENLITRIEHVTSQDDATTKDRILTDYSEGKYQFIFIAPERFQIKSFRQYLEKISKSFTISYAVIDEVHCLSEWGHDFRTSYLNLSKTIKKYCTESVRFIALTATASLNVLKDIKLELGISDENVKTLTDYSRPELDFEVVADKGLKYNALVDLIRKEDSKHNHLRVKGNDAGIIFTPTVNGYSGCAPIAEKLSLDLETRVKFYSGSPPKINGVPMNQKEFDVLKQEVQDSFKNNELPLIVATKAFGMGVNKKNISYTIHYGIPGSMESLYQEAGRAGRDKERYINDHARCYVLFGENTKAENIDFVWDQSTNNQELKERVNDVDGDLSSSLFMLQLSLEEEETDFRVIKEVLSKFAVPNKKNVLVTAKDIQIRIKQKNGRERIVGNKAYTEKAIYRLTQLGIVDDWTVKDFFKGEFEVDFKDYSERSIYNALLKTIAKYSDKNVEDEIIKGAFNLHNDKSKIDQCIYALIAWINKHFVYNRRQSLKNIYETCERYEHSSPETRSQEFKEALENYFKFNESSFILQHIAENSFDYEKWFEVFYLLKTQGQKQYRTDEVLDKHGMMSLQGNLARFLESYANNLGLNFISGIARLINDDFEDQDGKNRLYQSFVKLEELGWKLQDKENVRKEIIVETCKVVGAFPKHTRNALAEFLIEFFREDISLLKLINEYLEDDFTLAILAEHYTTRLITINKQFNEQIDGIR